jgi:hypothetical protein
MNSSQRDQEEAHTLCEGIPDPKDESAAERASHPQREDSKELGDCCTLERRAFKLGIVGEVGSSGREESDKFVLIFVPTTKLDGL